MKNNSKFWRIVLALSFISMLGALYWIKDYRPKYSLYVPTEESAFKITFEYPSGWIWEERDLFWNGFGHIYATNPDSNEPFSGTVTIQVSSYESSEIARKEMSDSIASFLEAKQLNRADVLSDRVSKVDGYVARHFSMKEGVAFSLGLYEPLITERTYILVDESYYYVQFSILASARDSEFANGFDHMIETLKFTP